MNCERAPASNAAITKAMFRWNSSAPFGFHDVDCRVTRLLVPDLARIRFAPADPMQAQSEVKPRYGVHQTNTTSISTTVGWSTSALSIYAVVRGVKL
jgi:hypothetical protein